MCEVLVLGSVEMDYHNSLCGFLQPTSTSCRLRQTLNIRVENNLHSCWELQHMLCKITVFLLMVSSSFSLSGQFDVVTSCLL